MNTLLALLVPLLWALTILVARLAVREVEPLWANALRFASMGLLALLHPGVRQRLQRGRGALLPAAAAGALLYLSILLTTVAVDRTTIASTVFYATFYAFFIPLIKVVFFRTRYQASLLVVLGLALAGAAGMADLSIARFGPGEAAAVAGAVFYALYVLLIERITHDYSGSELIGLQGVAMALFSLPAAFAFAAPLRLAAIPRPGVLGVAIFGWVLLTVLAYGLQAQVQRRVPAHVLGLLFTLDAPLGALLGWLLFAEAVPLHTAIGGGLVTLAAALAPWLAREKTRLVADRG